MFGPLPAMDDALHALLQQVPAGSVTTYGALAIALGDRIAAAWVGHALQHHPHTDDCLCHRAVRADGTLGRVLTEDVRQRALRLQQEGWQLSKTSPPAVDRDRIAKVDFQGSRPLAELRARQEVARELVRLQPAPLPDLVGGLDVSYVSPHVGVAAYTLYDWRQRELVWSTVVRRPASFPYITSYLSFRELPLLIEAVAEAQRHGRLADLLLVDGAGVLHPRGIGIAAHLGVELNHPTVGVAKTQLCGKIDERHGHATQGDARWCAIRLDSADNREEVMGTALWTSTEAKNPLFVSPGHRTDVASAQAAAVATLAGHRLPEPLYLADRLSRAATK